MAQPIRRDLVLWPPARGRPRRIPVIRNRFRPRRRSRG